MTRPPLAVTMGEPAGVGGEITLNAWSALRRRPDCAFFILDDPGRLRRLTQALNLDITIEAIDAPDAAHDIFPSALPVLPLPESVSTTPGAIAADAQAMVVFAIDEAVRLALTGEAAGVVTNPIQKSALMETGFAFPGHTEYLEHLTKDAPMTGARGAVMLLACDALKVTPVTVHLPLRDAVKTLSSEAVLRTGRIVAEGLKRDFGIAAPRLAIAGLNPHAGEGGALGAEDAEIIAPAVAALGAEGIDARGPLPADTMFHAEARAGYDAALAMYHDQALIPIKTLDFFGGVNITLGLPIIRTSPDHGTALEIAGKGLARPDSFIAAVKRAADMTAKRALA